MRVTFRLTTQPSFLPSASLSPGKHQELLQYNPITARHRCCEPGNVRTLTAYAPGNGTEKIGTFESPPNMRKLQGKTQQKSPARARSSVWKICNYRMASVNNIFCLVNFHRGVHNISSKMAGTVSYNSCRTHEARLDLSRRN